MEHEIKALEEIYDRDYSRLAVFLAGTIDNGNSANWQAEAAYHLTEKFVVLNPRRDDWNPNASYQDIREQAGWEMAAMDSADYILMNFLPNSQSPITLAELGLYADTGKLVVVCPPGFYRKANVDEICERYRILQKDTLQEAIEWLKANGTILGTFEVHKDETSN